MVASLTSATTPLALVPAAATQWECLVAVTMRAACAEHDLDRGKHEKHPEARERDDHRHSELHAICNTHPGFGPPKHGAPDDHKAHYRVRTVHAWSLNATVSAQGVHRLRAAYESERFEERDVAAAAPDAGEEQVGEDRRCENTRTAASATGVSWMRE